MSTYDAIVVGAGPAGSVCAARLAGAGRKVLVLEKSRFPRDKVCGDCLNPSVWPIIERLGLSERLLARPHVVAREVSFHGMRQSPLRFPIPDSREIVIKRSDLDALLVERARECGAEFLDGTSALRIAKSWTVETTRGVYSAPMLFAADGRNSTLARSIGSLPEARRERIAIQCHCPRPPWHGDEVRMLFYPEGYGGTAAVTDDEITLCLVANPKDLARVRARAEADFDLPESTAWRTIAPLARADAAVAARDGLFLLGDAARVVEPFTGEGIYYAMRSAELAADTVLSAPDPETAYRRAHAEMYRGRLWVNRLSRLAGSHPRVTSMALRALRAWPAPLGALTAKVVAQT